MLLTIVAVTLPLYWLGEPGRHEGRDLDTWRIFNNRGEEIYVEGAQCVTCHGAGRCTGGVVNTAITSESGEFVAQVNWKAPALNTLLSRHTEDEVLHVLNFGRNGVMPAWGGGGGGPLTDQQLEEVIFYLRTRADLTEEEIRAEVTSRCRRRQRKRTHHSPPAKTTGRSNSATANRRQGRRPPWAVRMLGRDAGLRVLECSDGSSRSAWPTPRPAPACTDATAAAQANRSMRPSPIGTTRSTQRPEPPPRRWRSMPTRRSATKATRKRFASPRSRSCRPRTPSTARRPTSSGARSSSPTPAANGTYSCARCHTYGWSFDGASEFTIEDNGRDGPIPELADGYVQGGRLLRAEPARAIRLRDQFETARQSGRLHRARVRAIGARPTVEAAPAATARCPVSVRLTETNPVGPGMGPGTGVEFSYPGLLTEAQIDAIVAFERTL